LPQQELDGVSTAQTLTSSVYERLKADVLRCRFEAGAKLRVLAIAELYQAGASPVREALTRLAGEGLLRQIDKRGFRVPNVSLDDLEELTRTRCLINEVALRQSIQHGDSEWEEGLVLALHYLLREPLQNEAGKRTLSADYEIKHRNFHRALIAGCRSHWIVDFCETLFDLVDRYRHLWTECDATNRDIKAEHAAIAEAALARNADEAVSRMNDHIMLTAQFIADSQRKRPASAPRGSRTSRSKPRKSKAK